MEGRDKAAEMACESWMTGFCGEGGGEYDQQVPATVTGGKPETVSDCAC